MHEKRRAFFNSTLETRELPDSEELVIEGYFAVFNSETELWAGFFEEIAPNAFDESLKESDILCLNNHDLKEPLARESNGTLDLKTDERGLWGSARINKNDPQGVSAYEKVRTGLIKGCSFAFNPIQEEIENRDDGTVKVRIIEADIGEVSICTIPAYPQTEIAARQKEINDQKRLELEAKKAKLKKRLEGFTC
jgi:HK97 family phage prohead protease